MCVVVVVVFLADYMQLSTMFLNYPTKVSWRTINWYFSWASMENVCWNQKISLQITKLASIKLPEMPIISRPIHVDKDRKRKCYWAGAYLVPSVKPAVVWVVFWCLPIVFHDDWSSSVCPSLYLVYPSTVKKKITQLDK